jgi:P-type conjugative transfer protein TrbJ
MKPEKFLAAKAALAMALWPPGDDGAAQAGIPVIDGGNLVQNVMTAIESWRRRSSKSSSTGRSCSSTKTCCRNTLAPAAYIWDQAQSTINGLMNAINTLNYYKNQLGSIDNYLGKFQDVAYYRSSPCFNSLAGARPPSGPRWSKTAASRARAQKKANDALFKGLDSSRTRPASDARQLQRLQSAAQGATGQMQAIGYANQLASQQANQLCRSGAC